MAGRPQADLNLPEGDFVYNAGATERPWAQFVGRWRAIRPFMSEMLRSFGTTRPLRVVDLGSCTGYMALQAAHWHPEADVVGIEGSVGVGNGRVGMQGAARQILQTGAVQTHLRWIQAANLPNCFVAPEVWDYVRVCELAASGRPISDVMFMLSVVHHIDGVSHQQYADAGLSKVDGFTDLMAKLLLLSPHQFIEMPNKPWITPSYDTYRTARKILEVAAKASGKNWKFRGPIYSSEWFGQRDVWILECEDPMPQVDVQSCPFPLLYRGDEVDLTDPREDDAFDALDDSIGGDLQLSFPSDLGLPRDAGLASAFQGTDAARHARGGLYIDPGLMVLQGGPCEPVDDQVGEALAQAPTDLLIAHLALRDAVQEAQRMLEEARRNSAVDERDAAANPTLGGGRALNNYFIAPDRQMVRA